MRTLLGAALGAKKQEEKEKKKKKSKKKKRRERTKKKKKTILCGCSLSVLSKALFSSWATSKAYTVIFYSQYIDLSADITLPFAPFGFSVGWGVGLNLSYRRVGSSRTTVGAGLPWTKSRIACRGNCVFRRSPCRFTGLCYWSACWVDCLSSTTILWVGGRFLLIRFVCLLFTPSRL